MKENREGVMGWLLSPSVNLQTKSVNGEANRKVKLIFRI